jgi:hypothetical protein
MVFKCDIYVDIKKYTITKIKDTIGYPTTNIGRKADPAWVSHLDLAC